MSRADDLRRFLYGRRFSYIKTFRNPEGENVLADLAQFCRANETTFHTDPALAALQEGRREVWLRIQEHLNLSPEELFELVTGEKQRKSVPIQTDTED